MTNRTSHFKSLLLNVTLLAGIATGGAISAHAQPLSEQTQAEEIIRHTVVENDTLWDISANYLEQPWKWQELWQQNTQISDPDLIYPGDVLLISSSSIRLLRKKTLGTTKLSPKVLVEPLHAITTIDIRVILPFLSQSIIVEPGALENSAYVLQGTDDKIILGGGSRFYARGLKPSKSTQYLLFNIGRTIEDEVTGISYGVEGVHLGIAYEIRREGDISELEIIRANQDVRPGDRLIALDNPSDLPRYFPRRPDTQIDTRIISIPKGVNEAARRDVVIITGGRADGLREGHVLEVFSFKGEIKDPVSGKMVALPDNKIATAMVFKLYEKVSYALLMESTGPIKIGDRASTPRS
jgi:hypothetical protein